MTLSLYLSLSSYSPTNSSDRSPNQHAPVLCTPLPLASCLPISLSSPPLIGRIGMRSISEAAADWWKGSSLPARAEKSPVFLGPLLLGHGGVEWGVWCSG
ncbi:hypothetical protein ACOMHN_035606 [Nucella lapillus]